jgi:hypothetical protein
VVGLPLGPVAHELSGDCRTNTSVLYTERQRLELHPEADWPFRVVGTQLGVAAYQQKYGPGEPQRRSDLAGDAIAEQRFKHFYEAYGGLPVFGYPISNLLNEPDAESGQKLTVQYFERARFELIPGAPPDAELLAQVRLGALGREYPGIATQCGLPPTAMPASVSQPLAKAPVAQAPEPAADSAPEPGGSRWLWVAVGLLALLLAGAAIWETRRRRALWQRRLARRHELIRHNRRTREMRRPSTSSGGTQAVAHKRREDDDELLRRLLSD